MLLAYEKAAMGQRRRIRRDQFDWFYDATDVTLSGSDIATMRNQGTHASGDAAPLGGTPVARALWSGGKYAFTPVSQATSMRVGATAPINVVNASWLFVGEMPSSALMSSDYRVILGNAGTTWFPWYTAPTANQWEINQGTPRAWGATRPAASTKFACVVRCNGASSKLDMRLAGGSVLSAAVAGGIGTNGSGATSVPIGIASTFQFPWSAPIAAVGKGVGSTIWSDTDVMLRLGEAIAEYGI